MSSSSYPPNPPNPPSASPYKLTSPEARGASFRMLLIDEVSYVSGLDKEGFRQQRVLVYTAQNYQASREILDKKSVDVVCCNLDFSGGEGRYILRELHKKYADDHCYDKKVVLWVAVVSDTRTLPPDDPLMDIVQLIFKPPLKRATFISKIRQALTHRERAYERFLSKDR